MTPVEELLAHLHRKGVVIRRDGKRLAVDAPRGVVTTEILSTLRRHKPGILALLGQEETTDEPSPRPRDKDHGGPRRCFACRGTRFWISIYGVTVCGKCHPPATDALIAGWHPSHTEAEVD